LAGVAVYIHYGGQAGVFENDAIVPLYVLAGVTVVGSCLIVYRMRGKALAEAAEDKTSGNDEQSEKL